MTEDRGDRGLAAGRREPGRPRTRHYDGWDSGGPAATPWQTREGSVIDLMEVSARVRRNDPGARSLLDVIVAAYAATYNEREERMLAKLAAVLAAAKARDTARARQLIASFTPEEETELQTEIRRLAQHDVEIAEWLADL